MKYVKSQRNYGYLIFKELIFGFQILDLIDHFSASLRRLFSEKVTFQRQNCENATSKTARNKDKGGFLV